MTIYNDIHKLSVCLSLAAALFGGGLAGCGDDSSADGDTMDGDSGTGADTDGGGMVEQDAAMASDGGTDAGGGVMGTPIGEDGGEVSGPDGVKLTIPAGALSEEVEIAVREDGAASVGSAYQLVGKIYELLPDGLTFDVPITVQLPYAEDDIPPALSAASLFALHSSDGGTTWERVDGSAADGVFNFPVSHFSLVALAVKMVGACTFDFSGSLQHSDADHQIVYDAMGLITSETRHEDTDRNGTPEYGSRDTNTHDAAGRRLTNLREMLDMADAVTSTVLTTHTHDASGNLTSEVVERDNDASGTVDSRNTTTRTYDANDNLTMELLSSDNNADGTADSTRTTTQTYDAMGNLTLKDFSGDTNADGTPDQRNRDTYTYDANGNQTSHAQEGLDPTGATVTSRYTTTTTYDANGNSLTVVYEGDNNADSTLDTRTTTTRTYDAMGNLATEKVDVDNGADGNIDNTTDKTFNAAGNLLTSVTTTSQYKSTETNTYDANGYRTLSVVESDNGNDGSVDGKATYTFTVDADGQVTAEVQDTDSNNDGTIDGKRTTTRTFDAMGHLLTEDIVIDSNADGTPESIQKWAHTFDADGLETMRSNTDDTNADGTPEFGYDGMASHMGTCGWLDPDPFERVWFQGF